jgi:hypothetical protein
MKKILLIIAYCVTNQIFSQNQIVSISPSMGSSGTVIKIVGNSDWGKHCAVYLGTSNASTVSVKGNTIMATVQNGDTGPITVFDADKAVTCTMDNFCFTFYPKIQINESLVEYKNSKKKGLFLFGNGLSGIKSAKIDDVEINLGSGLTILSDSKAYILLPERVTSTVVTVTNPLENISVKYE